MSQEDVARGAPPFSILGVIADTLRVLGRNLVPCLLAAFVLRLGWVFGAAPSDGGAAASFADWPGQVGNPLLRLALAGLAQLLFAFVTLRTLQGGRAALADFARGLRAAVAAVMLTLICFLPPFCGFLLRVILPVQHATGAFVGMMIAVASLIAVVVWWLGVSVVAIERRGALGGLARCVQLTRGRRWRVLGIIAIVAVLFAGGGFLATSVLGLSAADAAIPVPITAARAAWFLVTVVLAAFLAIMATVVYYRLRIEKEGAFTALP